MTDARIIKARTSAFIPFTTDFKLDDACRAHAERDYGGDLFWTETFFRGEGKGAHSPGPVEQLVELAPWVRVLFGGRHEHEWEDREQHYSPAAREFTLNQEVLASLNDSGWTTHHTPLEEGIGTLMKVQLYFFPLGAGLLRFHFEWNHELLALRASGALEEQVNTYLEWITFVRRLEKSGLLWKLSDQMRTEIANSLPESAQRGIEEKKGVRTKTLAHWLLTPPETDVHSSRSRQSSSYFCFQQNLISFDRKPALDKHTLLWRLANGFTTQFGAPSLVDQDVATLSPRSNRVLGFARQGIAVISWRERPDDEYDFETDGLPKQLFEVFELLYATNLAQRLALTRLADDVTKNVNAIPDLRDTESRYEEIRATHRRMERLLLTMPGADPGGIADYVQFYQRARAALGVAGLQEEVAAKSRLLNDIAEAHHQNLREEMAREEEKKRDGFQKLVSQIGYVFIPFTAVTGLLGVNAFDLGSLSHLLSALGLAASTSLIGLWILRTKIAAVESTDGDGSLEQ